MILCLNCSSDSKISNSKTELQYFGGKSKLSAETFDKLGYQIKSFSEKSPTEWHKQQFKTLWTRVYLVKNRISLKDQLNTFPRYTVIEEVYDNAELAAERFERIQERQPNLPGEQQYYWMVKGFKHQKNVYFVQTAASVFNYYMKDFADKLAEEVGKE